MTLRVTILGCGSSGGVPRVGGDWGICDPNEPKNRRTRCSILVEKWEGDVVPPAKERTTILVDTSPDLREQFLRENITHVDALLYTHDHADQTHGIDDLRAIAYRMRKRISTYMDAYTKDYIFNRFDYCFEMPEGRVHPAILELQYLISDGDKFTIEGPGGPVKVEALGLSHGPTPALGFLFDNRLAYTPDVWDIEDDVLDRLDGIDTWIVDALRYNDHPTHANADKALSWLARTRVSHGVLTNLHIDMDYNHLCAELPCPQCVAHDGLVLDLS